MEISHHRVLADRANRETGKKILEAARVNSTDADQAAPPGDGLVCMPGVKRPGGIRAMIAPPTGERLFELQTRLEACDNSWQQDRHVAIERKRRLPVIGNYIANKLHDRMTTAVQKRRAEAQQARF